MYQDIKLRHKYTVGENKGYEGFSRILVELANEKVYDKRAAKGRGENDMGTDLVGPEARHPRREAPNDEHPRLQRARLERLGGTLLMAHVCLAT